MSEGAVTITEEIEELKKKLALLGKPHFREESEDSSLMYLHLSVLWVTDQRSCCWFMWKLFD